MTTSAEVRRRLAAAGRHVSVGKMSAWWSTTPVGIRLDDLQVLCAVLACEPSARPTPSLYQHRRSRPGRCDDILSVGNGAPRRRAGRSLEVGLGVRRRTARTGRSGRFEEVDDGKPVLAVDEGSTAEERCCPRLR
ncbi:helix-turn-helix transcriptional regulator [Streptomyces sp. NPDC005329]|uniref:helix-turn-helix domain-containing protein n=1 Tax=Streptomyces sp. NPDC005329 TaxID=3157034 RepID=UPI0033B4BAF9